MARRSARTLVFWSAAASASVWCLVASLWYESRVTAALTANQAKYHRQAVALLHGQPWRLPADQSVLYPPALAAAYAVLGPRPRAVRVGQALLAAGSVVLVALGARTLLGGPAGAAAALAYGCQPVLALMAGQLVPAVPALFLEAVGLWLLAGRRRLAWTAGGLALGLSAAFQSLSLVLVGVVGLAVVLVRRYRPMAPAYWLGALLVLVPIWIANYLGARRFVPLTDNAGTNLALGWNPAADGANPFPTPEFREYVRRGRDEAAMAKSALGFIFRCPRRAGALAVRKAALFVAPGLVPNNEDLATRRKAVPFPRWFPVMALVLWLAVLGFLEEGRVRHPSVAGPVVAGLIVSVGFFTCSRFRLVALPGFAAAAGAGLLALWSSLRARRAPRIVSVVLGVPLAVFLVWDPTGSRGMRFSELVANDAVEALRRGRRAEAGRLFAEATTLDPSNTLAHLYQARLAVQEGRTCVAWGHAAMALAASPLERRTVETFHRLGRRLGIPIQVRHGLWSRARRAFEERYQAWMNGCGGGGLVAPSAILRESFRACAHQGEVFREKVERRKGGKP